MAKLIIEINQELKDKLIMKCIRLSSKEERRITIKERVTKLIINDVKQRG